MQLEGKTAVVVGATRGIGRYFALALGQAGAAVVVAGRSDAPGELPGTIHEVAEEIRRAGGKALPVRANAAEPESMARLIGTTVAQLGSIDVLVNNAAAMGAMPFLNLSPRDFDRAFAINVRGPLFASQAAVPHMLARGGGSIINITSLAALRYTTDHSSLYSVSKAALNRLTTWLAEEYRPHNIAVNALSPGSVITEQVQKSLDDPDSPLSGYDIDWAHPSVDYLGPPLVHLAQQRGDGITGQILWVPEYGKSWP
jgi:NAD(P)-dependent dehydrogenase (short-subunit alcohol dehydrogenase family)